jgi:hypothetical protein
MRILRGYTDMQMTRMRTSDSIRESVIRDLIRESAMT